MADTDTPDILKLAETFIIGVASGKGVTLSPAEIGPLVTKCAAWAAELVTNSVKKTAAADAEAAADKITSLETAEAAQEKL